MNWKKFVLTAVGGLFLLVGATYKVWFGHPKLAMSFFLSGYGTPEIDFVYQNPDKEDVITTISPQLLETPTLFEVELDTHRTQKLEVKIRNLNGKMTISDLFVSGQGFATMEAVAGEGAEVLQNDNYNFTLKAEANADINVCNDCFIKNEKSFKPCIFGLITGIYLLICAIIVTLYLLRHKLKDKLLQVYTLKNYALILPYAKPYWFRAVLAVVITIPVGAMDAVIAWSLKPFMDVVLVEKQTGWTMYIPLMIVVFSVLQALFTYLATYMNTWVGNKIALDVKRKLFNKLLRNDAEFFDKTNSGEILFRFNQDAEMACSGLLNSMKLFTTRFFSSMSLIIVLFYNSWKLAIVAVVVMFGALMPLAKTRKRLKKMVSKDANVMATLLTHYNEAFNGNRIITAYNLTDFCKAKFIETINNLIDLGLQMVKKTGIISPIMHVISSFGIAFVIWFGSYLIVSHQMTVGNFASFITSLVMLYNPIKSIGNNFNGVLFSLMAVERVFEKLNSVPKIKNKDNCKKLENCKGNISYENVRFEYVKNKPVLRGINLEIKSGQTIALVGNSGGGKTTISALLPRFYDVKSGKIKIDGEDIRNLDIDSLRENIAIVFQDNFLFGGTIRENILLGRTDITEEKLNEILRSACLDEFIKTLDMGLETQVGEHGVMLSGGQKQRIAIARAFIKNAPILILDEATSALDNKSEAIVQQAIDNLMKDRTVLIIAHRLSTVRNADRIIVINDGEIAEQGSHDELLKAEGAYAALYRTQLV